MQFECDPGKAALNLEKHGVVFEDATTVCGDPLASTIVDEDSTEEDRFVTIGVSSSPMWLVVVHTGRDDRIRIINARRATRPEQKQYEEGREGG